MIALLRKALAARGYKIDEESDLQNAQDAQGYASTVLRFKQNNVTHVLPFGPLATQLFMQMADGQRYYPRYGLSSNNVLGSRDQRDARTARRRYPRSRRGAACIRFRRAARGRR